ncbi:MAG TPA: hypothetical protein VHE60_10110 [Pyrinomonadaceae bacterium]|nr:hypothetical protein [Pyrinomonadaceae bacterium]
MAIEYLLVLTACIDPSCGPALIALRDPLVRLEQYRKALEYWLLNKDLRLKSILFLENSGYPLDRLAELVAKNNPLKKKVEFIQLSNNDFPAYLDYGYPELGMLDEATSVSNLMQESRYFIKATGRLTFPKVSKLLDRLPADYLFAVDCRLPFLTGSSPTVNSNLMIFSSEFYKTELVNVKSKMNDVFRNMETLLYYKLMDYYKTPGAILRWPISVDPVGCDAQWGKSYNTPRRKVISATRSVSRAFLPGLWI